MNLKTLEHNLIELLTKNCGNVKAGLIKAGVDRNTIYNIQCGRFPSIEKIAKIADTYNVSVDYLLGRVPQGTETEQQLLLSLYEMCDAKAKDEVLNYMEYQVGLSKQRANTQDNAQNRNNR